MEEYQVFQDHGEAQYDPKSRKVSNALNAYLKIRIHLIFAVKHEDISLQILLKASTMALSLSDPVGWSYS